MKKYKVKGFAMVPVEVEMIVEAQGEAAAGIKAERLFKEKGRQLIVANSADESAVHDFKFHTLELVTVAPASLNGGKGGKPLSAAAWRILRSLPMLRSQINPGVAHKLTGEGYAVEELKACPHGSYRGQKAWLKRTALGRRAVEA